MTVAPKYAVVLSALVFLLCPVTSPQQTQTAGTSEGILTGVVADKFKNAPIRSAFIYVYGGTRQGDFVPKVDSRGRFRVSLSPSLYSVFVAAEGFAPTCAVVQVNAGKTTDYNPRLGADNEHLQQ